MSDSANHQPHRRPHSPLHGGTAHGVRSRGGGSSPKAETAWSTGHNARTLVKHEDLRVVLIAVQRDARIPEHQTEGRVSVHVISGHIQLRASGRIFNLRTGGLLALDPAIRHDVIAIEESAFLLTIAWPDKR